MPDKAGRSRRKSEANVNFMPEEAGLADSKGD